MTSKLIRKFTLTLSTIASTALASITVLSAQALAQEAAAPVAAPQPPGTFSMLVPFIAMFGVMYFLMIRPQQKKAREQAAMMSALQSGDEVLLSSGILGKVKSVEDKFLGLEIASGVTIRVMKSQVVQKNPSLTTLAENSKAKSTEGLSLNN